MTAQAGAVAYIDLADTPYGRGWTTSHEPLQMPVGRYLHESAAVPVEALEGLVAKWREASDTKYPRGMKAREMSPEVRYEVEGRCEQMDACADELTQLIERSKGLIKERSNG